MNFWEFLDRQLGRVTATGIAGAGIFALTAMVILMLADDKELGNNDLFKVLAQAIVVQGLVGLAMAAWFTRNNREGPLDVEIQQPIDNPVPVKDQHRKK